MSVSKSERSLLTELFSECSEIENRLIRALYLASQLKNKVRTATSGCQEALADDVFDLRARTQGAISRLDSVNGLLRRLKH
jgi:hypothetical protein